MSPATRRTTRTQNLNAHPEGVVPKRTRRTKEQIAAAKEAVKATQKQKEVEKEKKLTNVAQATDNIVLEMQAQDASEPRVRPARRPLKRTYAMLDVTQEDSTSDKENLLATSETGEQSEAYVPSAHSDSELEAMDPASDSGAASDSHVVVVVEPPKKKRGKTKKTSVLKEIEAKRKHLFPIPEEVEHEEQGMLMEEPAREHSSSHVHAIAESQHRQLPFKAGLKKAWVAQRTGDVLSEPTLLAPKASKNSATKHAGPGLSSGADPMHDKRAMSSLPPAANQECILEPKAVKAKLNFKPTEKPNAVPDISRAETSRPHPRPRPRPVSKPCMPETPVPSVDYRYVPSPQASPVNYGGIPEDETDTEEQAAARSSPIKAGQRVTSNSIVTIRPVGQTGTRATSQNKAAAFLATRPDLEVASSTFVDSDNEAAAPANIHKPKKYMPPHAHTATKPQMIPTRPQAEPEVVDDSEPDQEVEESAHDRASVAPSEGHTRQNYGSGSRLQSAKYDHLPAGASRGVFKDVFMPTVAKYLVKLANQDPWNTASAECTRVIQCVWDEVFPSVPYHFSPYGKRCDVFRLINQRIYEWRAKFGHAAVEAVLDLEASDDSYRNSDFRKEWVMWAMEDGIWPFLYADVAADSSEDWTGTFASTLILKTFAAHLVYTANAIVVKKLRSLEAKWPVSALALATTAVERALTLWDDGDLKDWRLLREKDRPSLPKFDAGTWAHKTQAWILSINTLYSDSWDDIFEGTQKHIKPTSRKPPSHRVVTVAIDARAMLVGRPRRK